MGKAGTAVRLAKSARKALREANRPHAIVSYPPLNQTVSETLAYLRSGKAPAIKTKAARRLSISAHGLYDTGTYAGTSGKEPVTRFADLSAHSFGAAMQQARKAMAYLKKKHPEHYRVIKDTADALASHSDLIQTYKRARGVIDKGYEAALRASHAIGAKPGKQAQAHAKKLRTQANMLAERNLLPAGVVAAASGRKKEKK